MSYGALVALPANEGTPYLAITIQSMVPVFCTRSRAMRPASLSLSSISCTGGMPKGMNDGACIGASTMLVNDDSIPAGSKAPKMRGRYVLSQ